MPARGVNTINVNGREVHILFTNRALLSAEKQLGKGIVGVLQELGGGNAGIGDLQALLRCGMEAARQDERRGGLPISNEVAMDVIDEIGFAAALVPVVEAVAAVISYSQGEPEDKGEEAPN